MILITSSNIRFDNPQDGKHAWGARRSALAACLLDNRPHIIGTQEGRRKQLEDLESLLVGYEMVQKHRDWIEERMYPSLFVDTKKVEVLESRDIWLSHTPDVPGTKIEQSAFPRLCTGARLLLKEERREIHVFNVHLDHMEESTRLLQAEILAGEIQKITQKDTPVVLMGDFNTHPESQVRAKLAIGGEALFDPWKSLGLAEQSSYHRFLGSFPKGKRIDWILHSKEISAVKIEMDKSCHQGIYPSDHFPVKASLTLQDKLSPP